MALTEVIGWSASIITIVYTSFGLPSQIIKNVKLKSTEGLSLFLLIFLFLTFASWVVYGYVKFDLFITIPNAIGAIFTSILLYQIIYYKR